MKFSSLAERTPRVALLSLLALGAYTGAQACPCGCVRVPVDNLADRPAALAGAYTLDVRYDAINQDERDNGVHPHFTARHRNVTATVETSLLGVDWYLVVPRIDRTIATASASGKAVGLGDVSVGTRFKIGDYRLIAGVKLPTGADDLTWSRLAATCSPARAPPTSCSVSGATMPRPPVRRRSSGSCPRRLRWLTTRTSAPARPSPVRPD